LLRIDFDREADGRWIGEIVELPGVLAYGATREEALRRTEALALHVIADRLEHDEPIPFKPSDLFLSAA
jgi:predicted RNase H-like HicB family nuclease